MGCDIHVHAEVKINGEWHHYSMPNVGRNYMLFTLMADVRSHPSYEIKPIAEPRGLPSDMTFLTYYDAQRWATDGHSHSYLTAEELPHIEEFMKKRYTNGWSELSQWGYLFGNSWGDFVTYPEEQPPGLEDVRWIFWFDN